MIAMSAAEPPNFYGSSAGWCADTAEPTYEERLAAIRGAKRGPPVKLTIMAPLPADKFSGCRRCGMKGQHVTPDGCIRALRDRLARWE
jgi:hypothetical protein